MKSPTCEFELFIEQGERWQIQPQHLATLDSYSVRMRHGTVSIVLYFERPEQLRSLSYLLASAATMLLDDESERINAQRFSLPAEALPVPQTDRPDGIDLSKPGPTP